MSSSTSLRSAATGQTTAASSAATARSRHSSHVQREFVFVPFGGSASNAQAKSTSSTSEPRPTISCDGRVSGVTLELTHWKNNVTPDKLYADTSTEMALNLAEACLLNKDDQQDYAYLQHALVLNNHYDTDGLASTFACLEPELALEHRQLLLSAAEAGDFGEWNTDAGVQLNLALEAWLEQHESNDEEIAYQTALEIMPELLQDFQSNQGESFQYLWNEAWNQLLQDYDTFANNLDQTIVPATACPNDMAIVIEPPQQSTPISSLAIYRALRESSHWPNQMGTAGGGPIRILRARPATATPQVNDDHKQTFTYHYEMIGHGWVQRLVQRRICPEVPSVDDLVCDLNSMEDQSNPNVWKTGGVSGLVSICQTLQAVQVPPQEMASRLAKYDSILAATVVG